MDIKFLSSDFYNNYPSSIYPELMLKPNRPYIQILTRISNNLFAIPLRSNISHNNNVFWTNKSMRKGLDFTKSVLILDNNTSYFITVPKNK